MSRLSNLSPRERRGAPRSEATLSAYLITHAGNQLRGAVKNLSRSGVFVEIKMPAEWLVGESARLVFTIRDGNVVRLARYSVLIVRETQHGVGVAFWRSMHSTRFSRG